VRTEEARTQLDYREVLAKLTNAKPLNDRDLQILASRKDIPVDTLTRYVGKRYGQAFLRAFSGAQTTLEKLAVLQTYEKLNQQYGPREEPPHVP
jgi:hypothetical protein